MKTVSRDRSKIQCYCCDGFRSTAKDCPLMRQATEASDGSGINTGSSSTVTVDGSEDPSDPCQILLHEWANAEFSLLLGGYTSGVIQ